MWPLTLSTIWGEFGKECLTFTGNLLCPGQYTTLLTNSVFSKSEPDQTRAHPAEESILNEIALSLHLFGPIVLSLFKHKHLDFTNMIFGNISGHFSTSISKLQPDVFPSPMKDNNSVFRKLAFIKKLLSKKSSLHILHGALRVFV